jgi:hypothetical protein
MNRKAVVAALAGLALLVAAVVSAVATTTGGGGSAAAPTRLGPNEEFSYLGQGSNESGEAGRSAAQEDYENRAFPSDTIGFDQTLAAIAAGKKLKGNGSKLNAKWKELGPDTLEIGQFGTQNLMVPTQWTGRIAAVAVDSRHCSVVACKLYIGSAGGGVWMTNNALAQRPQWQEKNDGLDSRAIGSITIDPTDATGNTIYVGTGEENGSSDNEGRPRRLQVDRRRQPLVGAAWQRCGREGPRRRRHCNRPDEPEPHLHRDDGRPPRRLEHEWRTVHAAGRAAPRAVRVDGRRQHVHAYLLA